jgi:striatin 1/3/4
MLPSRNYQPSYPPPRNIHGQQQQQQLPNQGNIYQQGPGNSLPTYDLRALNQPTSQQQQQQQQQQSQPQAQTQHLPQAQEAVGGGGEMNLASVLHYLQSEWRRWERDRNEWEIERAEMRVSDPYRKVIKARQGHYIALSLSCLA